MYGHREMLEMIKQMRSSPDRGPFSLCIVHYHKILVSKSDYAIGLGPEDSVRATAEPFLGDEL